MMSPMVNESTVNCMNRAIMKNYDRIQFYIQHYVEEQFAIYAQCQKNLMKHHVRNVGDPILLQRLFGTFLIWLVGMAVALLWFGGELVPCKWRRHQQTFNIRHE